MPTFVPTHMPTVASTAPTKRAPLRIHRGTHLCADTDYLREQRSAHHGANVRPDCRFHDFDGSGWSCAGSCCDSYSCDDVKGMSKGCASSCSLSTLNIRVNKSYGCFCIFATASLNGARPYNAQDMVGLALLLAGLRSNLA